MFPVGAIRGLRGLYVPCNLGRAANQRPGRSERVIMQTNTRDTPGKTSSGVVWARSSSLALPPVCVKGIQLKKAHSISLPFDILGMNIYIEEGESVSVCCSHGHGMSCSHAGDSLESVTSCHPVFLSVTPSAESACFVVSTPSYEYKKRGSETQWSVNYQV